MKNLTFAKMHSCGNDYVFFYDPHEEIVPTADWVIALSDRHTGIGSDGVVLILPSQKADAKMRIWNSDGSEAGMCGNAIRCVAKYLYDTGVVKQKHMRIETNSGIRELFLTVSNDEVVIVKVDMGKPQLRPEDIPTALEGDDSVINTYLNIGESDYYITCVSMGNPHAIIFCEYVAAVDLTSIGPVIEHHPTFPLRTNVEFVEVVEKNRIKVRVWERGSGETLACGTGASAASVAAVLNGHCEKNADIIVTLPGGDLMVLYTDDTVYLTGDCHLVFEGNVKHPSSTDLLI